MRSIYDDILERDFKTDAEGNTVFFANGLTNPGYLIHDEEKKNEIKKIISRYSTLFIVFFVGAVLISNLILSSICLFILLLIHFGWYRRKINQAVSGLPHSGLVRKRDSAGMLVVICCISIICFLVFLGLFWVGIKKSGNERVIIISLSLFFLMLTAVTIGYYIYTKKKEDKDL